MSRSVRNETIGSKLAYRIVTLITGVCLGYAIQWWMCLFSLTPQCGGIDSRGEIELQIYVPAVCLTLIAAVLASRLHKQVRQRASQILLTINLIFLFWYLLVFLTFWAILVVPIPIMIILFLILLLAGTPFLAYQLLKRDSDPEATES